MILIFSDSADVDTNIVSRWLNYYEAPYTRINRQDAISIRQIDFQHNSILLNHNDNIIDLNTIESVWYRRGGIKHLNTTPKQINMTTHPIGHTLSRVIANNLQGERDTLIKYIESKLEEKRCLTRFSQGNVNKLINLEMAKSHGLTTPMTWVVTANDQLQNMAGLITKSLESGIYYQTKTHGYYTYTEGVDEDILLEGAENPFFPSLVQGKIPKTVELRIFFLEDEYFPMAIFSQKNETSRTDNRKGSGQNQLAPYRLPGHIISKLKRLMHTMSLKTGSIDMIVTPDDEFVFLEVNPVGQIGMTSYPCNFNLHEKIAKWLMNSN